jgi:hypothetical protein
MVYPETPSACLRKAIKVAGAKPNRKEGVGFGNPALKNMEAKLLRADELKSSSDGIVPAQGLAACIGFTFFPARLAFHRSQTTKEDYEMLRGSRHIRNAIAVTVALFTFQYPVHALPVYDVAADFSFASNPNGAWQYGSEATLGSSLSLYTSKSTHLTGATPDIESWRTPADIDPNVSYNPTAGNVTYASTTFLPGHVTLHPGPANQYSVIRFTAPTAGQYSLTGDFNMRSFGGTHSTDVHILLDNDTPNE